MKDMRYCLEKMEAAGRLARVLTPVDAVHELSGISAKLEGGKALLFEHVKGYDLPLTTGWWWSRENVAAIFDRPAADIPWLFADAVDSLKTAPVAPVEDQMPRMQPNSATNRAYHTVSSLQPTEYIKSINPVRKPVLYCRMQHKSAPASSEDVVFLVFSAISRMTMGGNSVRMPSSILSSSFSRFRRDFAAPPGIVHVYFTTCWVKQ